MTLMKDAGNKELMMATLKSLELMVIQEIGKETDELLEDIIDRICGEFLRHRAIYKFEIKEVTDEFVDVQIMFQILPIEGTVWSTKFMKKSKKNSDG